MKGETYMEKLGVNRGLSGFGLKWIAIASMVIDHIGSILFSTQGLLAPYMQDGILAVTEEMPLLVAHAFQIKAVCEILGSIGFPIFCFLIVEGFLHTSHRLGYGLRLALFALITEPCFDLAHYQSLFQPRLQNVMFTLTVSVFTLLLVSRAEERLADWGWLRWACQALAVAAGMGVSLLLRGEYVFLGVSAMALMYLLRDKGRWRLLGLAPLLVASPWVLLALIPLWCYGGQRGRGSKWFFYVFYPAHFLVLAGAAALLSR